MKQTRLYLIILIPLLIAIGAVIWTGSAGSDTAMSAPGADYSLAAVLKAALHSPLSTVLLQLIVILFVAKGMGWLFVRFGQQSVMGEITAGLLLGPSCLGLLAPGLFHSLFPASSLAILNVLSQVGLLLFMFVIGMELDIDALRSRFGESLVISHSSIAFPFLLGVIFSYFSFDRFGTPGSKFAAYALFMGIALSITAFPVLARILKERQMTTSPIGSLALICAAMNDVTAWCILPVVVAVSKAESMTGVVVTIALTVAFVGLMIFAVKPMLQRYYDRQKTDAGGGLAFISVAMLTLLISALIAEVIGIHALFGAFIAGAVLPGSKPLRHSLTERLEDLSLSLLLPVFFVMTGLRTSIGALSGGSMWEVFVCIILLAVAGKLLGSAVAARLSGLSWRDSMTIGALMNTRGLMELIVINIGYELGILSREVFTMMVLMALVTTFMTAPLLNLIERVHKPTKVSV